ncbi:MAG TPA: phosphopantetheine-binding protein [Candidatus Acidoferrum sp.]|nr:phosphopantetheine-binding protein [Candidatus Acidoferrum sp.]
MNRDQVRSTFLELIKPHIRIADTGAISDSSLLVNDLKVNSTRFVDIILEVEDRFNITIPDDDMERFGRVGDAIEFICQKADAA